MKIKTVAAILLIACNAGTVKIHAMENGSKIFIVSDYNPVRQSIDDVLDNIKKTITDIVTIGNSGKQPKGLVKKSESLKKLHEEMDMKRLSKKQQSNLLESINKKIFEIKFPCTFTVTIHGCELTICENKKDPQDKVEELFMTVNTKGAKKKRDYIHPKNYWIKLRDILGPLFSIRKALIENLAQKNKTSHCPQIAGIAETHTGQMEIETLVCNSPVYRKKQETSNIPDNIKTTITKVIRLGNLGEQPEKFKEKSELLEELQKKIDLKQLSETKKSKLLKFVEKSFDSINFPCKKIIPNYQLTICNKHNQVKIQKLREKTNLKKNTEENEYVHPKNYSINLLEVFCPFILLYDDLVDALDQKK